MTTIKLTQEQENKLKRTCLNLFMNGIPSLRFIRTLHNDFQVYCNDDLNSPDDFYNMSRIENKPMNDLLFMLGYAFTDFGVVKIN